MAVNQAALDEAIVAISESASLGDALIALNERGADTEILSTVAAISTIAATVFNEQKFTGASLGVIGYALSTEAMIEQLADGNLTIDDAAAIAGYLGAGLRYINLN